MSDYITQTQLEKALKDNNKIIIDEMSEVMRDLMDGFDRRFTKIEKDIEDIKISIDRLTNTIDGFVKRLDDIETDNTARDAQYARLVAWAKEVSKKTGIPMPQL